jgi:hypothetical protein
MKPRQTVSLHSKLDQQIQNYVTNSTANSVSGRNLFAAAALGAIGLGSVALPQDLYAEIVFTPAHQSIGNENAFSTMSIDFNHDGIPDLTLSAYNFASFSSGGHFRGDLWGQALNANQILVSNRGFGAALPQGQAIGSKGNFRNNVGMAECVESSDGFSFFSSSTGPWLLAKNRFLGVKFSINGETHYGWARLTAGCGYATLTGFAYESVANRPIDTGFAVSGFSGGLGALALGSGGVTLRHRPGRKSSAHPFQNPVVAP